MDCPELFEEWNNQYLINLSVFNGIALEELRSELVGKELELSTFYEPDLGDVLTGIVLFENGDGHVSQALSHLRLASK